MKIFSTEYLETLTQRAQKSPRLRQHQNIHCDYHDPCQRLFNAIEPDSYIRPHRHFSVPREELLMAVRGLMALVTFDDSGQVTRILHFGSGKYGPEIHAGAEVPSDTWHTVLALEPGSVLLEIKAGPFDPAQPKDLAPWSPEENAQDAPLYLEDLRTKCRAMDLRCTKQAR